MNIKKLKSEIAVIVHNGKKVHFVDEWFADSIIDLLIKKGILKTIEDNR